MIDAIVVGVGIVILGGCVLVGTTLTLAARSRSRQRISDAPPLPASFDVNDAVAFIRATAPLVTANSLKILNQSVSVDGEENVRIRLTVDESDLVGRGKSLREAAQHLVRQHPQLAEALSPWL